MSCLESLLGYFAGELRALQLIVLQVFGVVYQQLVSCMFVHFLEIQFEKAVGL